MISKRRFCLIDTSTHNNNTVVILDVGKKRHQKDHWAFIAHSTVMFA